uniref:Sulfotransferase n=1 Tax=Rhodopseudomonas palustris (strain DX-1) TaxID=652103 RepID=E6VQ41_RHOPX
MTQAVFCVGSAKSGTHSIVGIFERALRCGHEPEAHLLINRALRGEKLSNECARVFWRTRWQRLNLDLESSQILVYFIDEIVHAFPTARFLFTFRDPASWLVSFINHQLTRSASAEWLAFRHFRFGGAAHSHSRHAQILEELGLFSLDGYLSYWAWHNMTLLNRLPPEATLMISTKRITQSAGDIARFIGVSAHEIGQETHRYKALSSFPVLASIEPGFLQARIDAHCAEVWMRLAPFANQSRLLSSPREPQ